MTDREEELGASLFGRTLDLMEDDPLEEFFALNMGDFISEYLISEDLANKIGKNAKNKSEKLKSQLRELISIYSLDKTLCVLGFSSQEEYVVYNSIAKTLTQILDVDACHIYLTEDFTKGLNFENKLLGLVGSSIEFDEDMYAKKLGYTKGDKSIVVQAFEEVEKVQIKDISEIQNFTPIYELKEFDVKSLAVVPIHNNAHVVGVIVIENYKEKTIKRTIKFSQKLQQICPEYIKARYCEKPAEILQYLSNSDTIKDILNREDHRNLRNYNRFFYLFVHVYENVMTLSFKRSYKNEFLNEILICLRNSVLYSLIYTDEVPALETFYLPRGYVRIEMFPSIKTFVDQGFLNLEMLKKDLERRIGVYKFDSSVSGDFATIRNWVKLPRQKTLKSFARIIKKSNKFTTYDLFLETMRYLSWFFNSEMIDEDLYKQYKNLLLKNFKKHLLQQEDINLTISGMSTEREFIDVLNECKEIKTQEKLGQYERALFTKNKLLDDAEFVEFVRKNPTLVLTMYTKNASKVAKVKKLYIHTKFLLSCLKHSPALALIKPSPWIEFASKIIDYLDDPTSAAVAQMILDEVITKSAPPYTELNEKLKRRKEMLLKRDDTKQK